MACLLYPSGVTEMFEPKDFTFTDEEILSVFNDYDQVRTERLYEIPNTWCVWGENKKIDETNYNRLASDIMEENIFSHILFIHDTQINPAWMLTDQIILTGYEQFKEDLLMFFDAVAQHVLSETHDDRQEGNSNLVFLNTIGPTADKRVLFEFDPHKQSKEFYQDIFFINFADKVKEFLTNNFKNQDVFYIYADKKTLIFIKDENVEFIMDTMINTYKRKENYEYCQELINILERWKTIKTSKSKKLVKKRKTK